MTRRFIQNNISKNKIAKLRNTVRGPYKIIYSTGEVKFIGYDLYVLPYLLNHDTLLSFQILNI